MEIVGSIAFILFIIVICLLVKVINLESINKELRLQIMERSFFVIESLATLEKLGEYYIDGDADPLPVAGCVVAYHKKNGRLKWTGSGKFFPNKEPIRGYQLHEYLNEELLDQEVLNRNYLDFLLKHPDLIPQNWPALIPFWGTIYRRVSDGHCFVKCLVKREGIYSVKNRWLDSYFDEDMPAIIK